MNRQMGDDEIWVMGSHGSHRRRLRPWVWWALGLAAAALLVVAVILLRGRGMKKVGEAEPPAEPDAGWLLRGADTTSACILHRSVEADSTTLHVYVPVKATARLCMGEPDTNDESILFATLAADLRRDNGRIVGAFVHNGEPLSWGLSKRGYCAIIDGKVTVGVAENSPLFEKATETGGDFFRQYAAVDSGRCVAKNPEYSAFRRALCVIGGRVCIVCSESRMTMNEFSSALAGVGVSDGIFLVGGTADGWYRDGDGNVVRLGREAYRKNRFLNYLVFRRQ